MAGSEPPAEQPGVGSRSIVEPDVVLLFLRGSIGPSDVPALWDRVCALLRDRDADVVICDLSELSSANVSTLDALLRLALGAQRLGRQVRLRHASAELCDLFALAGVTGVVSWGAASAGKPRG